MNIKILQGVNFESYHTTVKIELDKDINKVLIKDILSIHSLFAKKHSYKNNRTLIVQTKLPRLWENIAYELDKDTPDKKIKHKIFEIIIKKQIKSMSTIAILDAADKINEEITPFLLMEGRYLRTYTIGCGSKSSITTSFSSLQDSAFAKKIQMDKYTTNLLLERLNFPLAPWSTVESKKQLIEIFKRYNKPVVLKPTSLTGGNGVHTNLKNYKQLEYAWNDINKILHEKQITESRKKVMIQEQVEGNDFRLLLINGKLEAATERVPAFIKGDGASTIEELIKTTNLESDRDITKPTHTLKPIKIDNNLLNFLKDQKLTINDIPTAGKRVYLRKVASMSQGGITIDSTNNVHSHIKYICESIAKSLNAYTLGIDIICKDISKPLSPKNGSIIEINTMPEAYLNLFPKIGKKRPEIAKKLIHGLLKNKAKTNKIVVISSKKPFIKAKTNIGTYYNNAIYINEELINKNIKTRDAIESLKINSSLENIVVHYRTTSEVKKYGLGFDKIDTLYYDKKYKDEIKKLDKKYISKFIEI